MTAPQYNSSAQSSFSSHGGTVRDYVTLQRGMTYKGALVGKPGPALLGLGSIVPGGGFREADYKTYGGDCPPHLMLSPGDLFVSLKGATKDGEMIGSIARLPDSVPTGRLTQDTVGLTFLAPSDETISYIYWVLRTPQYRAYCAGHATGSAVVALSRDDFLDYPVPPLTKVRQRLVTLFDALEQKIELNRQMNETLVALARRLFKSWFVDFDPVHVKAALRREQPKLSNADLSRRALPNMAPEIAELFPDSFQESTVGLVPNGWKTARVDELAGINSWTLGKNDSLATIDYIEISEVMRGDVGNIERFTRGDEPSRARRRLRHGDIVLSTVRPDRGAYFVCLHPSDTLIASTGFAVVTAASVPWSWCATALSSPDIFEYLGLQADGGAYPAVNPSIIGALQFPVPQHANILDAFHAICEPLLEMAHTNRLESKRLAAVRDKVLPRLISGDLISASV